MSTTWQRLDNLSYFKKMRDELRSEQNFRRSAGRPNTIFVATYGDVTDEQLVLDIIDYENRVEAIVVELEQEAGHD